MNECNLEYSEFRDQWGCDACWYGLGITSTSTSLPPVATPPPSQYPAFATTLYPTTATSTVISTESSESVTPIFNATAIFSYNFLEIYIKIIVNGGIYLVHEIVDDYFDCSNIFTQQTSNLLSESSECDWDFNSQTITIILSSLSTIQLTDGLIIQQNVLSVAVGTQAIVTNENNILMNSIGIDWNIAVIPIIALNNLPQKIGLCDDLTLDARNSYNFGMLY